MPPFPQPLLDALRAAPDTPVFEHVTHAGTRVVTRGEFLELIRRLAAALRGAGLGPGSGLAIRTAVTPEAFAAHMAAHAVGCRVVGVRPGYPPGQLAHVLGTGVSAYLVDEPVTFPPGPALLSLGPVPEADDLLAVADGGAPLAVTARPGDVAALHFTSGSTGRPKGCAVTYAALSRHWAWQPAAWSRAAHEFATRFERYLLFGTLASMVVLEHVAPCLLGGGVAVIPEDDGRPMFPYALERHRITGAIITVPRLCAMLDLLRTEPVDVSSLRALMVSGSPIGPARLREAVERLGPVVYQGYGQTEAGNIAMLTPTDIAAGPDRVLGSVGRPHPQVEVSVRDEAEREVDMGHTGEIYVRAPYQMTRYWRQEEETQDTLRDGWLRTRDLGYQDADGFLYLVGRTRDVIMVNAMVVYAGPIEQVLMGHPDVAEAYVAGAPDERSGEAVHAFVVLDGRRTPDLDALTALVRAELGEGSVPRTITVVPGVPMAATGKPDKRALLAMHGMPPHASPVSGLG